MAGSIENMTCIIYLHVSFLSIAFKSFIDGKDNCTQSVVPGRVAQSVTCLATYASLTADPGVASSIPARSILSWRLIMK